MHPSRKTWWQQATALVTVTTGGAIAGLTFVPGTAATITSPTSIPLHLLALEQGAHPGDANARAVGAESPGSAASDRLLRTAIVNVAKYYLQLAKIRSPAQMEALIWDNTSLNEADHGESCAAFASLTLELAAQAVGQRSWVSGGSTYPWPLPDWADVRVDPNPASLAVTSIVQDAQTHQRWHSLDDGYQPQPGDWVVFSGHVEVVTGYADGTLNTIGADSLPGLTVNAHAFRDPLGDDGVAGFVDNGNLKPASTVATVGGASSDGTGAGAAAADTGSADTDARSGNQAAGTDAGGAQIPGVVAPVPATPAAPTPTPTPASTSTVSGAPAATKPAVTREPYRKYTAQHQATSPGTRQQQEFINLIAPGAIAGQHRYGVPAAVTIAQAIEESSWGSSSLAADDHNLFGIKGTGPAGSVSLPTSEYLNGQWVTINAAFRVYHNVAESISDHAELLATSGYYQRAMADRAVPDAFANDLTGVYATDPDYGANLIALMRLYNLYRFDVTAATQHTPAAHPGVSHVQTSQPQTAHAAHAAAASPTGTAGHASIPGMAAPALAPTSGTATSSASASAGFIPGTVSPSSFGLTAFTPTAAAPAATATATAVPPAVVTQAGSAARAAGVAAPATPRYKPQLPTAVSNVWLNTAKVPLMHAEQLYREVAGHASIPWELLAACDWMQCKAHPRYSPVHGEKIGTLNADGTTYRTKSQALAQCATDLVTLAAAVYRIDLTSPWPLPVRCLADAFASFRWGSLLKRHRVSALEFPYSVAGLTDQHTKMHWPVIDDPAAPDRPGARFREPFGAVPVVLSLNYPATVLAHTKRR
jgi:flagellum-specific peptidoglycan hydrolase FlgJ